MFRKSLKFLKLKVATPTKNRLLESLSSLLELKFLAVSITRVNLNINFTQINRYFVNHSDLPGPALRKPILAASAFLDCLPAFTHFLRRQGPPMFSITNCSYCM